MRFIIYSAALAATASAATLRRDQCSFQISATGGVSGVMGQLSDGQNRINGSYSAVTYTYSNGGIIDSSGRGCIVTMDNDATHQFQCDLGKAPTYGFSIAGNGSILYQGNEQFYACPATDTEYNVYTQWLKGQDKCTPVKLSTNGTCANASPGAGYSIPVSTVISPTPAHYSSYGFSTVSASESVSQGTVPVYVPQPSIPGYGSTPQESFPSYETSSVPTAPAYVSQATVVTSLVPEVTVSTYATLEGQSSAIETTQATAPSYESIPVPEYSSGYQSASQTTSSAVSESIPAVPTAYTAPAYSASAPTSAPWTVTQETTVWETPCSNSQIESLGGAPSGYASVASSSVVVPSETVEVPSYSTLAVSTPVQETISQATAVGYSSISQASVPSYGTPSQATVPRYNTAVTSASTFAISTAPAYSYVQSSSSQPATSASGSACQTSLSGAYQTPHLIVPITSSSPDTAAGTQYNATINSETSTIFNFDIPQDYEGKTCSVIFLFPKQEDLETSAYDFSGSGSIEFSELSGIATEQTTYNNAPEMAESLGSIAIQSGNSYVVSTGSCAAGTTESIELSSAGGLSLEFFEDWNPSSLGLYITAC